MFINMSEIKEYLEKINTADIITLILKLIYP